MEVKREYASDIFRSLAGLKLWEARHSEVLDFIDQNQVLTILDLGTSESTLLMKVQRGLQIQKMAGLDIDDQAITKAVENLLPEGIQNDYQFRRQYDQTVQLYKGSALEKYPHLKAINFELVTLVEVIEHIEEKYLAELNENVFGYLRPKWVWLSTPNFEFNSVFKWKESAQKFRHDDHKFEWTRKEFQDYVESVCGKYQYRATITGVGLAAKD
jgi:2-polyprenyl-3-methyl-5-hydroxy-6-metoxy-1,4-benzoquinol methylase